MCAVFSLRGIDGLADPGYVYCTNRARRPIAQVSRKLVNENSSPASRFAAAASHRFSPSSPDALLFLRDAMASLGSGRGDVGGGEVLLASALGEAHEGDFVLGDEALDASHEGLADLAIAAGEGDRWPLSGAREWRRPSNTGLSPSSGLLSAPGLPRASLMLRWLATDRRLRETPELLGGMRLAR